MKPTRDEFEKLAIEQLDTLYRVAWRLTGKPALSEDLVQETYLRALRARDGFDLQQCGIRPWLLRIMHNLFISRQERARREPQAMDEQQLDTTVSRDGNGAMPPTPRGYDGMDQRLAAALEALPPEYGSVIMLWAVDELSYKEIAEALEIPIGTVMSRLHRARQRLVGDLQELAKEQRIVRE